MMARAHGRKGLKRLLFGLFTLFIVVPVWVAACWIVGWNATASTFDDGVELGEEFTKHELLKDSDYYIAMEHDDYFRGESFEEDPECEVLSATHGALERDPDHSKEGIDLLSSRVFYGRYLPPESGYHLISCDRKAVLLDGYDVDEADDFALVAFSFGVYGGVLLGLIGLCLVIAGWVALVRSARKRRRQAAAQQGPRPASPPMGQHWH